MLTTQSWMNQLYSAGADQKSNQHCKDENIPDLADAL